MFNKCREKELGFRKDWKLHLKMITNSSVDQWGVAILRFLLTKKIMKILNKKTAMKWNNGQSDLLKAFINRKVGKVHWT